jgi:outer membrane autotransporter protein
VQIRPELTLAWQREWADRSRQTDATFVSSDAPEFRVEGPRQGRNALVVNASVGVSLSDRCSTYLAYDGILGRERYETHTVSGGLRVAF